MEASDVLMALREIPEWYNGDDFGGAEVALELLATAIIRADLVDSGKAKRASKLSKILKLIPPSPDTSNKAVQFAEEIEGYISSASYGEFSDEIIEKTDYAIESLVNTLEPWLEGLINEG